MIIKNKDIIQSYLLTIAKYDFNVYEKRIMYRLIEAMQSEIKGKKIGTKIIIQKNLFEDRVVTMPLNAFLKDGDEHYTEIKKALLSLRNKTIEYEDDKIWKPVGIIEKPVFYKKGHIQFELPIEIYNALLNFSKGFRKIELAKAMQFKSVYSMRFYELMSNQTRPIVFTIKDLKIMFRVEDKYKENYDFIRKCVKVAKKELDALSPYSFEFEELKTGREITALKFHPVKIVTNRDEDLETRTLKQRIGLSSLMRPLVKKYLVENFFFNEQEIRNNLDLFKACDDRFDLMAELSLLRRKCESARNPKGYLIGALKKKVEKALETSILIE